jgi:hypothetical protein
MLGIILMKNPKVNFFLSLMNWIHKIIGYANYSESALGKNNFHQNQ